MKRFLAVIAMMITMLCGSIMLVSCSNNYKKMYLVVEYALPTKDDKVEWHQVDLEKGFDYTISESVSSLYMRVRVEGTSKKVDSLYISQSVNTAAFLQTTSVAPNETFEIIIKNTGSVRFTITPSQGGTDKAVSFGVNLYKQIERISQNVNCVPAFVTGGSVEISKLTVWWKCLCNIFRKTKIYKNWTNSIRTYSNGYLLSAFFGKNWTKI